MSLIRQFAGQTIIYGVSHMLSRVLYFLILSSYLTYTLDDSYEYGLYTLMYSYATVIIVLLSYRMDTAFFRFGSSEGTLEKTFSTAFFPLIFSTVFCVGGIILFSGSISSALSLSAYPHYFKWFAIILGFDVLSLLPYGKFRLENKAKNFAIYKVANIVLTIILIFYFFEFYHPREGANGWVQSLFPAWGQLVDYVFIANLLASLIMFILLCFNLKGIKFIIDWALWKKMFMYSLPLIIVGVASSINQYFSAQFQQFFLTGSIDDNISEVGVYGAAMRLAALLIMFNSAFNYAAEPFFFRNANRKNDKDIYAKVLSLYSMCSIGLIVLLVYNLEIIAYVVGENYRAAIHLVPILLLAYFMLGLYYNVSIWYKISDKTIYGSYISLFGVLITVLISYYCIPVYGYAGSAWAALACYTSMVALALIWGKKYYPIRYDLKKLMIWLMLVVFLIFLNQWIVGLNLATIFLVLIKGIILIAFFSFLGYTNKNLLGELKR